MSKVKKFNEYQSINEIRSISHLEIKRARNTVYNSIGIRNSKPIQDKILDDAIKQILAYEKDFRLDVFQQNT